MSEELYIDYSIRLIEAAKRAEKKRKRRKKKMIFEALGGLMNKTMNFLERRLRKVFKTEEIGELKDSFEEMTKDLLSNEKSDFEKFKMLKSLSVPISKVEQMLNEYCTGASQPANEEQREEASLSEAPPEKNLWEGLSKFIPQTKANLCRKLNEIYEKVIGEKSRLEQKNFFVRLWYRFKLLPWWGKALIVIAMLLILALIIKFAYKKITPFRNLVNKIRSGSSGVEKAIRNMVNANAKETIEAATVSADMFDGIEMQTNRKRTRR